MIWDQLTSAEIDALERNIPLIFPIAATEQHGPHLPLSTDRLIAEHFALQLHQEIPSQVLILPAVGVGCSDHHMDFCGTLTLTHQSFSNQVQDMVKSVAHHGFRNIILLNSHGGNQGVGQVIVESLGYQYPGLQLVLASWWRLAGKELVDLNQTGIGGVGHAGEFETSLMMSIAPELVRAEKVEMGKNQSGFSWARGDLLRSGRASHYQTMKQLTDNGVYGNPLMASKEKGEQITRVVVRQLSRVVKDLISN